MKKGFFSASVLVLVMILALAGCGKSGGESGGKKVSYPTKPINLVVGYAAGGSGDMSARAIAEPMQKLLGQPVAVINKAGGGGGVAAAEFARAKADGYTLMNGAYGTITLVPYQSNVGYTYKDFKAIARTVDVPLALAVKKDSPINSLKDFIEYAKKNPKKVRVGTPGAGTIQHVTLHRMNKEFGIDLQHMPYEGANPAVAALLGGHIEATLTGFTEVTGQYKSGQVKILGVTTDKRIQEFMPDVPTFKELGHDFVAGFWMGVFAPKDTPQEIVGILSDAVKKASESEEFKNACKKLYLLNAYLGPDEFSASIARDSESNQKMLQEMGIAKN